MLGPTLTNSAGTQQQAPAGSSASSLSQLGEDYTRFLSLLTAQISNQDPLAPMDSTQFVSQLAQLSQVEQAVKTNSNLESLQASIGGMLNSDSINLIGHDVTVQSNAITLKDNAADIVYSVPQGATAAKVEIYDPLNRLVRTMTGLPADAEGTNTATWDGRNDAGVEQLAGAYTVKVSAYDEAETLMPASSYKTATVTEVLFKTDGTFLVLDDGDVAHSHAVIAAR